MNPAPYNPRTIDPSSRLRLKKSLQRNGLVELLVWNRRTGVLVSGHQRLAILDELEGGLDYSLEVAVIDVDEVRERELNVSLNNEQMSGSFDLERLNDLVVSTEGLDLDALGFSPADLRDLFPDQLDPEHIFAPAPEVMAEVEKISQTREDTRSRREEGRSEGGSDGRDGVERDVESEVEAARQAESDLSASADAEAERIAGIKERKAAHRERAGEEDRAAYVSFVFGSHAELVRFLKALDLPDMAVQDGRYLAQRVGVDLDAVPDRV